MRPITVTVGPLASAAANNIRTASTGLAGALTLNGALVVSGVAVLDVVRRVLFTTGGADVGKTILLTGTGGSGNTQSETVTLVSAGTVASVLDYKTVTSAVLNTNSVGTIAIGTNGVAASAWIMLDPWAGPAGFQCNVSGTVNYTVQQTMDDPNSPTNAVAAADVAWLSCADAAVVGATANQQSNYNFPPTYARVLLNSGSGSVTMTLNQIGVVPQ